MISIVDPEELQHVLRPTIYAAAVKELPLAAARRMPVAPRPERRPGPDEPVSPSRHD